MDRYTIDIVKYNLKSPSWWEGQRAILTKEYQNISGEVIGKEAIVTILFPMQSIRFGEVIHRGLFFIRDLDTGVCIGGIDYEDLLLAG